MSYPLPGNPSVSAVASMIDLVHMIAKAAE